MKLDLQIEALVLHGFPNAGREQVAAAVAQALALLFEQRGMPAALAARGNLAVLDGASFHVSPREPAQSLSGQIAQSIYDSLADAANGSLKD